MSKQAPQPKRQVWADRVSGESKAAATGRILAREIPQKQIAAYAAKLLERDTLKRSLKALETDIDTLEGAYTTMLDKGFTCEPGDLRMVVDEATRRAVPKYKELFAQAAGPKAVEDAQEAAGFTTTKHVKVVSGKVQVPDGV